MVKTKMDNTNTITTGKNMTVDEKLAWLRGELGVFVSPVDLKGWIGQGKGFVLDVRSPELFGEGHLPGAFNIPFAELAGRIGEIPTNETVVVYCTDFTYMDARQAAVSLMENGIENVFVLLGGLDGWKMKGFAIVNGPVGETTIPTPGLN